MKIVTSLADLRVARTELVGSVGVVPTMGYLHAGHASLINRACRDCANVIVTLFVNPTQFGPNEDYERYPRDFDRDREMCEEIGVVILYAPIVDQVYPNGFVTGVDVGELTTRWEGASRPGHFRGVATVVAKLLNSTASHRAYFGEKDFQQLQVVRRLVSDLDIPTEIVGCATLREHDGLAMSSRNAYLTPSERPRAAAIYAGLRAARTALINGMSDAARLKDEITSMVASAGLTLDYAAIVNPTTLEPIERVSGQSRALVAARLGKVRLIDNIQLDPHL